MSDADLKNAHPDSSKVIWPYNFGQVVTQAMINQGLYDQCKLGSGSDGE